MMQSEIILTPSVAEITVNSNVDEECDICKKIFTKPMTLVLHKVKVHKQISCERDEIIFRKIKSTNLKPSYKCPNCDKVFRLMKLLKQHYCRVHQTKKFKCSICNLCMFAFERELRFHEKRCSLNKDRVDVIKPGKKGMTPIKTNLNRLSAAVGPSQDRPLVVVSTLVFNDRAITVECYKERKTERTILPKPYQSESTQTDFVKNDCQTQTDFNVVESAENNKICTLPSLFVSPKPLLNNHFSYPQPTTAATTASNCYDLVPISPHHRNSYSYMQMPSNGHYDHNNQLANSDVGSSCHPEQQDIFCQTYFPNMEDASVMVNINTGINQYVQVQQNQVDFFSRDSGTETPNFAQFVMGHEQTDQWTNTATDQVWSSFPDSLGEHPVSSSAFDGTFSLVDRPDFGPESAAAISNIETQTDFPVGPIPNDLMDLLLQNMETQTPMTLWPNTSNDHENFLIESHTQTSYIDVYDQNHFSSSQTQT